MTIDLAMRSMDGLRARFFLSGVRRGVLAVGVVTWLVLSVSTGAPATAMPNPIVLENSAAGASGWAATSTPQENINGYASEVSVLPGAVLHLHVSSAPASRYRVEIYRLGWYDGAGARLMACVPSCGGDEAGTAYPTPSPNPQTGEVVAGWPVTDTVPIGGDWTSGYYVARLVRTSGYRAGYAADVPFIVRETPGTDSTILVVAPVNTWEAYNGWGGKSLYAYNSGGVAATEVSFDRPFTTSTAMLPFRYEYPLVRFLERGGYDVSYTTDADVDADPGELLTHQLVITAGHDEYWSSTMRDAYEAARDAGTNLAFLGANTGYWQMRYADDRRAIVEYRSAAADPEPDPASKTVRFRDLQPPRPECSLLGVESTGFGSEDTVVAPFDVVVADGAAADPWLAGTGLHPGSVVPGIGGYEWDSIQPGCTHPGLKLLFHGNSGGEPLDAVRYTARSGARVFSAGSIDFAWGLDGFSSGQTSDPALERFMANALNDLQRPASPARVGVSIHARREIVVSVPAPRDHWVYEIQVFRMKASASSGGRIVCESVTWSCTDSHADRGSRVRYGVAYVNRWGTSALALSRRVRVRS
jgi:hypothetical protein